jgi:hypothetical protein
VDHRGRRRGDRALRLPREHLSVEFHAIQLIPPKFRPIIRGLSDFQRSRSPPSHRVRAKAPDAAGNQARKFIEELRQKRER